MGLTPEDADAIYDAFLDHGVLVVPGQAINIDQHLAFARIFGDLWELPEWNGARRVANRAIDDVSNIDDKGDLAGAASDKVMLQLANKLWHSDLSSNAVAAKMSCLHAMEIALEDGETEFADPQSAYAALPDDMKARLDGMLAEFSWSHSRIKAGYGGIKAEDMRKLVPPSRHPLVRTHPETGIKTLFLGGNLERIVGLEPDESNQLIDELTRFATQPQFVYRHRWAVNDLVIWDNRRTLHRATDYDANRYRRVMHRATVRDTGPTVGADNIILTPEIRRQDPRPFVLPIEA